MPFITEGDLQSLIASLLGRTNIRPRSITEDKLAVGAASAAIVQDGSISDVHIDNLTVAALSAGTITGESIVLTGVGTIESSNFISGSTGFQINYDGSVEFTTGTFSGSLEAGEIHIPDQVTANSFHVDTTGQMWLGSTAFIGAPFQVNAAGAVTATGVTVTGAITAGTGSSLPGGFLASGNVVANLTIDTGGWIRSQNYSAGLDGWAIDQDGTAEFNNVTIRGTLAVNDVSGWLSFTTGGGFRSSASGARLQFTNTDARHIDSYSGDGAETKIGNINWDVISAQDRLILEPAELGTAGGTVVTALALVGRSTANPGHITFESDSINYDAEDIHTFNINGVTKVTLESTYARFIRATSGQILELKYDGATAAQGGYISFLDTIDVRMGYVGYNNSDDLVFINEEASGNNIYDTEGIHTIRVASGEVARFTTSDVALTSLSGSIVARSGDGSNVGIDSNEMQARTSAGVAQKFNIQNLGGDLDLGSNIGGAIVNLLGPNVRLPHLGTLASGSGANLRLQTTDNEPREETSIGASKDIPGAHPIPLDYARRILNNDLAIMYQSTLEGDDNERWTPGVIAERMEEVVGPEMCIYRDMGKGPLMSVLYDRWAMLHNVILEDHEARLAALEAA